MSLQEELKALKKRIAELEEQAKEEQGFPRDGDKYWYIDDEGAVYPTSYDSHYIDRYRQTIDNVFKTEEQAEFVAEKLKVEAELRKYSGPASEGSAYIYRLADTNQIGLGVKFYSQSQGTIYFESAEKAQQAIEAVGRDRIKKYIFGVED